MRGVDGCDVPYLQNPPHSFGAAIASDICSMMLYLCATASYGPLSMVNSDAT
jgi:hypothetical protein